jgi:hypothetical protein
MGLGYLILEGELVGVLYINKKGLFLKKGLES